MVTYSSLLVMLVQLVERVPMPSTVTRGRGRSRVYHDRLFLKALVIMMVRRLTSAYELLSVLEQPTAEMQALRSLLCQESPNVRFSTRRTWERRLQDIASTLPAQVGCLGRHLVQLLQPWEECGRAVAIWLWPLSTPG